MNFNTIKDLVTEKTFKYWEMYNQETKVALIHSCLTKKLEFDPEYEVFVNLAYVKNIMYTRPITEYREFKNVVVSNKGRIYNLTTNKFYDGTVSSNGYSVFTSDRYVMVRHRALAYNFIPKPPRHMERTYSSLEVNHMDGVKANNDISNLEWVTHEENLEHARENGLVIMLFAEDHHSAIPMLATVVDIPGHKGQQFVVLGQRECEAAYVSHKALYKIRDRSNGCKTHKGCTWVPIDVNEMSLYQRGPSDDLKELIKAYIFDKTGKPALAKRKHEYVATDIKTGEVKIYVGSNELRDAGFGYTNVLGCIQGKAKQTKGHTFISRPISR